MNIGIAGASPMMIAGGGLLLVVLMLMLVSGQGAEKRLRDRIRALREIDVNPSAIAEAALLEQPDAKSLLLRFAAALGYRPDLPAPYAASLKVVIPIALAVAAGVFRLFRPVTSPLPAGVLALMAALGTATLLFKRKNGAYRKLLFRQIPDTMSLMLRAVRAGLPVAEAIRSISRESISPTREEFTRVAAETALGMPVELTLQRLFERTGIQEYAFFSVVIGLHGQTGGNLSETIENLADTVRRRVAMAAKAKALAAEGRLSAMVVGGLPFVVGVLISLTNPGYMAEFIDNPDGRLLVLAFAVLLSLGIFTSHWMTQRSTRD